MADLFGYVKPRARRRVLMVAIDAGLFPDGKACAHFLCKRCGHDSGWVYATIAEAKRGEPCPRCNA